VLELLTLDRAQLQMKVTKKTALHKFHSVWVTKSNGVSFKVSLLFCTANFVSKLPMLALQSTIRSIVESGFLHPITVTGQFLKGWTILPLQSWFQMPQNDL
jgi:hypothetical protein